jgi:mono/diheme cytochrome c family protein
MSARLLSIAGGLAALVSVAAAAHAEEPAEALIVNDCLSCHSRELLEQQRLTVKQWTAAVKKMQGWGALIEPEHVQTLVDYLAARFGPGAPRYETPALDVSAAAAALAPLPDGKFKNGDAAKGQKLYAQACASCHGVDAHGSDKGMNLADRPLLKRAPEFADATRKGRGRMPSFPLSNGDVASLLAWLRTLD